VVIGYAAGGLSSAGAQLCPVQTPAGSETLGKFSAPFEEPTVNGVVPTTHCDAVGCKCALDADGTTLHCKPAAVSIAVLQSQSPDAPASVVYFNGLEDTENIKTAQILDFGQVAGNDQTRVLTLDATNPVLSSIWETPSPADAGANPNGNQNEYLISGDLTNGQGKQTGAGALFCSDLVQLADGKILAAGGTSYYSEPYIAALGVGAQESEGLKSTRIYDPATKTWKQSGDMRYGRWYPGLVTLADGTVFVASGVSKLVKPIYPDRLNDSERNVVQTETFDPVSGSWTYNGPTADRSLPLFPRLHLLPNGFVYYDGAGQSFNPFGHSYDQALWNVVAGYDPATRTWTDLGIAGLPLNFTKAGLGGLVAALNPAGDSATEVGALQRLVGRVIDDPADLAQLVDPNVLQGQVVTADLSIVGAGFRGSTFSIMLPLEPDASGGYTKAEFLTAGGVTGFGTWESPGSYFSVPFSRIETIEVEPDGSLQHFSRLTGSLNQPRWYSSAVLLPDGSVVAFNGSDRDAVDFPGIECAIQQAERFDPASETWKPMAVSNRPRTYHDTAVLLPDGTVLVGGHATLPTLYGTDSTVPGGFPPYDGRDPSFEVFSPPYVFAAQRPVINTVAPATVTLGGVLTIQTPDAGNVESAVLIRNAALTHLVDGDQRSVVLPIDKQSNGRVEARLTANPAVLPAGPYMLFVNRVYAPGGPRIPSKSVQIVVQH
jgi:hypothetical protein